TAASFAAKAASTSSTRRTRASRPAKAKLKARFKSQLVRTSAAADTTAMRMPELDQDVLGQRATLIAGLRRIVSDGVVADDDALVAYDCDALTAYRQKPLAVVLPATADQVSEILRFCAKHKVKVVPRGAGTSLSGGALPLGDGILLGLSRMNK